MASAAPVTLDATTAAKVIRQVEQYFCDRRLTNDKFMVEKIEESEDGLVSLSFICSFGQMKVLLSLGGASTEEEVSEATLLAVADVLRQSSHLRVSEDGKRVGRKGIEVLKTDEDIATFCSSGATLDEAKAKDVLRQVEFYFSDSNLPRDAFLHKKVEESFDGMVSLSLICSFKRMKQHLGLDTSTAPETVPEDTVLAVAKVLCQSKSLHISKDGKKVGRSTKLLRPEQVIKQVDSRTVAVSPLPYNVNLEDVQSFFSQYSNVNSVRLPRRVQDKKVFCGTALVEFSEDEAACNIQSETVFFDGAELTIRPKKEFDWETAKMQEKYASSGGGTKRNSRDADGYPKGLILSFKVKKLQEGASQTKQENNPEKVDKKDCTAGAIDPANTDPMDTTVVEEEGVPTNQDSSNDKTADEKNSVVKEGNVEKQAKKPSETGILMREDVRKLFDTFGVVEFVDYSMGQESGYVRFEKVEAAEKARAFAAISDDGGFSTKFHFVTVEALSGEEEKKYWRNVLNGNQEKYRIMKAARDGKYLYNSKGGKFGKREREPLPALEEMKRQKKIVFEDSD